MYNNGSMSMYLVD